MEDTLGERDGRFATLAMALNALERSRADARLLLSYKCPCNDCKGGGRPILRSTIEAHLRRRGRDPTLTHCMLPEDSDMHEFDFNVMEEDNRPEEAEIPIQQEHSFDEGFDFERLAAEWFENVDDKRQSSNADNELDEENVDRLSEDRIDITHSNMEEWLRQSQVPLYPGSKIYALASVLVLMNLAHLHNVSNSFMNELFSFLRLDVLPCSNELPKSRHEARRLIDRLGLTFNTIHACRNGCVLFWKEKDSLEACPKCNSSRYTEGSKSIPVKVLRHFPLIPRLLRMYRCRDIAALMKWHDNESSTDGKMRSVLDSPAWKHVNSIDSEFFTESRNVKLGLALDGMNPFADKSTKHSTWPIFLLNYNLPGWLVTKRFFVMLSLLIPGKESVKSTNIDVYMEPLIDELIVLWNGVQAVDMSNSAQPSTFHLRGMLLWTIHDYPTYGLISGCTTKGYQGCPICGPHVESRFSKSLRKNLFQGHRRYLPIEHPYRLMKDSFNGREERRGRPPRVSGIEHRRRGEARERWLQAGGTAGSENDPVKRNGVKRNSILFLLPYWEKLMIRHVLDVMHCEKNIAENLLSTLLGFKDGLAVRNDMKESGCKKSLHIRNAKPLLTGYHVPKAPYVLSTENKTELLNRLRNLKTPTGYMSNLKKKIDPEGNIHSLKSHDYHVILQHALPVCLRGLLPDRIMKPILLISGVFRKLCSKVINLEEMQFIDEEVATVMCLFEREFPPSFFDPMTHLVVHLVEELHICGPVHNRWMYPLERYMKYMKSYVRNKARPEGCMATGTAMEVGLGLSTEYILECKSTGKRVWDSEEELGDSGEVLAFAYKFRSLSAEECQWAHACVLNNSSCLNSLREMHKRLSLEISNARASYRRGVHPRQRKRMQYPPELTLIPEFPMWLQNVVESGTQNVDDDVVDLSMPPRLRARSFKTMKAYRNHFRVASAEVNLVTADSGVTVSCETLQRSGVSDTNLLSGEVTYYGKIVEILELDYGRLKPTLLYCDWVAPISRGPTASVKKDKYGFTLIKLQRLMPKSGNSFVFPLQASQIFFSKCTAEPEWHAVVHTDSRSTRVYESSEVQSNSTFDADAQFLVEEIYESEELDSDTDDGLSENWGQHVTAKDLTSREEDVQVGSPEPYEDNSEDDTLLDSADEED